MSIQNRARKFAYEQTKNGRPLDAAELVEFAKAERKAAFEQAAEIADATSCAANNDAWLACQRAIAAEIRKATGADE